MDATMKGTNPIATDPLLQLSEPQQQYCTPPVVTHFPLSIPWKLYIQLFFLYYMTDATTATKANFFILVSLIFWVVHSSENSFWTTEIKKKLAINRMRYG